MVRKIALVVLSLLLIAPASAGVAREKPSVSVRVAKTARWVKPFGTVSPARKGTKVVVRFFKQRGDRYRLIAKKRRRIARDGSFRVRFQRPRRGECRVVVRVAGTRARDREPFPCYIPKFPSGSAEMTSLPSTTVGIDALIAETDEQRQYGLMYRPKLRADLGMAFMWESDTQGGFWMKNTLVPLSIAFFDANGVILRILDMEPCAEDPCPSYDPDVTYRGALEVNQGAFGEWGISEGDMITVEKGQ